MTILIVHHLLHEAFGGSVFVECTRAIYHLGQRRLSCLAHLFNSVRHQAIVTTISIFAHAEPREVKIVQRA